MWDTPSVPGNKSWIDSDTRSVAGKGLHECTEMDILSALYPPLSLPFALSLSLTHTMHINFKDINNTDTLTQFEALSGVKENLMALLVKLPSVENDQNFCLSSNEGQCQMRVFRGRLVTGKPVFWILWFNTDIANRWNVILYLIIMWWIEAESVDGHVFFFFLCFRYKHISK